MAAWALILVMTGAGIVPEALILTLLTLLFLAQFRREAFSHASWMGMLLVVTIPLGGTCGAAVSALISFRRLGQPTISP
jgi:hypothetical protein